MKVTSSRWIIVTEKNRWGADADLVTAFANAGLREQTVSEHFKYYLSPDDVARSPLADAMRDWNEYGKEEYKHQWEDNDKVAVMIFYFDADMWEGWDISPINGGVSFHNYLLDDDKASEVWARAQTPAYWHNGFITHRKA